MHINEDAVADMEVVEDDLAYVALREKFEELHDTEASEETLGALRQLLADAQIEPYPSLVQEILYEIAEVIYELNPELDDAFQKAVETSLYADLLTFQQLMESNEMTAESYPEGYDELLVELHPGVPHPFEFKSEFVSELDSWRTHRGQLQLAAHKAIHFEQPALAGYILALCYEYEEARKRLGMAGPQLIYELGSIVASYRNQLEASTH